MNMKEFSEEENIKGRGFRRFFLNTAPEGLEGRLWQGIDITGRGTLFGSGRQKTPTYGLGDTFPLSRHDSCVTDKTTIRAALAKVREAMASENLRKAQHQSRYRHVNWNKVHGVWQVHVSVHGMFFFIARYPHHEDWFAAQDADSARWHLQDFITRKPRYNFPHELPRLGDPHERIQKIRRSLITSGVPKNKPHDERFVPFTPIQEPSTELPAVCDVCFHRRDECSCSE